MGQDNLGTALQLLQKCAHDGTWLLLKNVHLVPAWLPRLDHALHALQPAPSFRLWLTAEPSDKFPASLLELCLVRAVHCFASRDLVWRLRLARSGASLHNAALMVTLYLL